MVSVSGTYSVTVTDAAGCTSTSTCSIQIPSNNNTCQGFRTQTQGGWGASPNGNNPAVYMTNHFASVFTSPNYLTVGCSTGNKLRLTSAQAVTDFLPSGSTPTGLPVGTLLNPGGSYSNVFAGQVVTLTLSVQFDLADPNFSFNSTHLSDLIVSGGPMIGMTVQQVLDEANKKLGGCSSSYSFSDLNNTVDMINQNYDDGTSDNGYLHCPSCNENNSCVGSRQAVHVQDATLEAVAFPNPFKSTATIQFTNGDVSSRAIVEIYGLDGNKIAELFNGTIEATQSYKVEWNAENLPNGLYMYRIICGDKVVTGRLALEK